MGQPTSARLSEAEHKQLSRLISSGSSSARTLTHVRILLLADRERQAKRSHQEIVEALMCGASMVGVICHRYVGEGLEAALREKARPGAAPKITGEVEAKLVILACSGPPDGRQRWTLRLRIRPTRAGLVPVQVAVQLVELGYV